MIAQAYGLFAVGGFAHKVKILVCEQEGHESTAHHRMVVHEHHADWPNGRVGAVLCLIARVAIHAPSM